MNKFLTVCILLASCSPARANNHEMTLLKNNGCLVCHSVDGKSGSAQLGPAYPKVAERYKNDPQALNKLVTKVKNGGYGNWGQIPMPPHPNVTEADLKTMISWVLKR